VKSFAPKLIDCIAIGNKRNFRVWLKPGDGAAVLENCLSAYSVNFGDKNHDVGFWFLNTGDATLTRCTAYGDRLALKIEGKEPKPANVTLDRCVLIPADGGKDKSVHEGSQLKETGTVSSGELTSPSKDWRGDSDAFNLKSNPEVGYRFKKD
jgi:hypothetical protein